MLPSDIFRGIAAKLAYCRLVCDSKFNVMKPKGISIGGFYERHFLADASFSAARFPKSVGGVWNGYAAGLVKPNGVVRTWYGMPMHLKVGGAITVGSGVVGAAIASRYDHE